MNSRSCAVFCFFCLIIALPAGANREKTVIVQVTGTVRLVGSAPITDLVITGQGMEWYIARNEEYKLKDLQQRVVTVKGSETVQSLSFASGLPAGERRILKNIKIISVQ